MAFLLVGKYGTAIVYTNELEESAVAQIIAILNHPIAEGANIRIMPDAHYGSGCVIGFTAKRTNKVVPNIVGVDQGCNILTFCLGERGMFQNSIHDILDLDSWDSFIRNGIPSGEKVRDKEYQLREVYEIFWPYFRYQYFESFQNDVMEVCKKQGQEFQRVMLSLGTLGNGNHFIELGKDEDDFIWQTFHAGSRHFGYESCHYHQKKAVEKCGKMGGMEYLEGEDLQDYYNDLQIAQEYAKLNTLAMAYELIHGYFKLNLDALHMVQSTHNYVDFQDNMIRKGAIRAYFGEELIIPFNMKDGLIIGEGRSSEAWNFSAPHGAGRQKARGKAKAEFELEDYQRVMDEAGVQSKCISQGTIDESPMAYKDADMIMDLIKETVTITNRVKPLFAFKAEEKEKKWKKKL